MNRNAPADRRPVLHLLRATCPRCGCPRLRAYRSQQVDGQTTVRYSWCSGCGLRVLLVVESPSFQKMETDSGGAGSMEGKGATVNLETLGRAAERFQQDPAILRAGLKAIQAEPRLTLNQVAYYDVGDVERAAAWIKETERQCQPS